MKNLKYIDRDSSDEIITPYVRSQIISEATKILVNILDGIEIGLIQKHQYDDLLFVLSQIFNLKIYKNYEKKIFDSIQLILSSLKDEVYAERMDILFFAGMTKGIGNISFSLTRLAKIDSSLKKFSKSFQDLFIEESIIFLNSISRQPKRSIHYDVLYGVAGIMNFFIDFEDDFGEIDLEIFANYLIDCFEDKDHKGIRVPNLHIQRSELLFDWEKSKYPNGLIDFGVAHGMIGILYPLAKYYQRTGCPQSKNIIDKYLNIYQSFSFFENGLIKYPTRIGPTNFVLNDIPEATFNESWCYGNLTITFLLMKIANIMGYEGSYNFYKNELLKIINLDIEGYSLSSTCICHGFAGLVTTQFDIYRSTDNLKFLSTFNRNIEKLIKDHKQHQTNDNCLDEPMDISFLESAAGILLAFSYIVEDNCDYSKLLLLQ